MKITYISHATLLIEVNGLKLVTDPWVKDTAYCNQWHLFPKATHPELIADANYVLYSHGHEDHLHAGSLQMINKQAAILYPYSWYGGTKAFFNDLGFTHVKEAFNERTIVLDGQVKVTYLANNLDNVMVIESGDTVLVNINDALPSASQSMIGYFLKKIKQRWPAPDYVFSSYGGASYFPNTVHFETKDDEEIAQTRERFFVNNFCKIVAGLRPRMAVPFASDFILLDDHQRWINRAKFPRYEIAPLFEQEHPDCDTKIIEAYPGDVFEGCNFFKRSRYHAVARQLLDTVDNDYKKEIEEKRTRKSMAAGQSAALKEKLKRHIVEKAYIIPTDIRKRIRFAVRVTDMPDDPVLTIDFRGETPAFSWQQQPQGDIDLLIDVGSQVLNHSMDHEWGGDAIIIGYGAEIYVYHADAIRYEIENYCVRLLSRYPNTKEYLKRTPLRAARYLLSDAIKRKNLIYKAMGRRDKVIDHSDPVLSERDLWLNKGKCAVCKACNLK